MDDGQVGKVVGEQSETAAVVPGTGTGTGDVLYLLSSVDGSTIGCARHATRTLMHDSHVNEISSRVYGASWRF